MKENNFYTCELISVLTYLGNGNYYVCCLEHIAFSTLFCLSLERSLVCFEVTVQSVPQNMLSVFAWWAVQ